MKALTLVASGAMVASRTGELFFYGSSLLAGAPCIHTPAALPKFMRALATFFFRCLLSLSFAT
jgi:hypothetical protein